MKNYEAVFQDRLDQSEFGLSFGAKVIYREIK